MSQQRFQEERFVFGLVNNAWNSKATSLFDMQRIVNSQQGETVFSNVTKRLTP
ncbi:MAG: hypothetical protein OEV64_15270 [Desulfobulbaceae bacterium]|nr:hypothetical protein [Desulfobulbaceae bacterium]